MKVHGQRCAHARVSVCVLCYSPEIGAGLVYDVTDAHRWILSIYNGDAGGGVFAFMPPCTA